ncbi:NAD(P)/FAD-dependent oxidoreductase [Photobacterium sp. 1_MG-2023]|uniref:FAD/NAD(P)-dependent oxidoreductase n=1 Tax=Photobacterium sp. 1_MG-2023 TaxID=3062646 RepID=UPI0026E469EA|nr:NAD(P)/FAD-dependent oxidoreductase [Photobacterium sp. 1_MG-2023]MDO6706636.1 NAD(P)/FAD-dependent oxidoreductase [Photobacterium sp. 1_MG-2023]
MSESIVVVGAGPAGMSIATTLSEHGIRTTVVDESPKAGGVIYRGPWRTTQAMPHLDENLQKKIRLQQELVVKHQANIQLQTETRVLGPLANNQLLLSHHDKLSQLDFDYLFLATGCQERSIPFPGWQLPGVMLTGGIQLQLKSGLVRPGHQAVLTGTGPLLILVACQLHRAGVAVQGVFDATPFMEISKEVLALLNRPQVTLEGMSLMAYLKRHRIPVKHGWGIVKAEGGDTLERVAVAPYNRNWEADKQHLEWIDADLLGVGYGFASRSQLAQLMDLNVRVDEFSGLIPVTDAQQRSSRENIFCAGDSARFAGADVAIVEGQIAALSLVAELKPEKATDIQAQLTELQKTLRRYYRFRGAFDRANQRKKGLLQLPEPDTVICRCEQVKRSAIDQAIQEGCRDTVSLKMRTRVTMGDCQGKTCSHYCYDRLAQEGFHNEQGHFRTRFPLDPIPFSAMEDEA